MRPSTMPKLSLMTLARGARQLVVQEALLRRQDRKRHVTITKSYFITFYIVYFKRRSWFDICFLAEHLHLSPDCYEEKKLDMMLYANK